MAILTPPPKMQFFDSNGDPLSGGKLYTYEAGTTTPLETYTDYEGLTPNANPVLLDSNGQASVWLGTDKYKFVLYNASDVLQPDGGDDIGGTYDASTLTYAPDLTGSVEATIQSRLEIFTSVTDFGATGDGSTNDTAAIQAAISAVPGQAVYFPSGTYVITANIDPEGCRLIGAGTGNNSVANTTLEFSSTYGFVQALENNHSYSIEKMELYGSASKTANGQVLVDFSGQNYPMMRDVRVWQAGIGIQIKGGTSVSSNYGFLINVDVNQCDIGINLQYDGAYSGNSASFFGGRLWDNMTAVVIGASISNALFSGTSFESNDTYGFDSLGTNIFFSGCRFEGNGIPGYIRLGAGKHVGNGNHWSETLGLVDETVDGMWFGEQGSSPTYARAKITGVNYLQNGLFEYNIDPDANGCPAPWLTTRMSGLDYVLSLEPTEADIGSNAIKIVTNTTTTMRMYQQDIKVVQGVQYIISVKYKLDVTGTNVKLKVGDNSSDSDAIHINHSFEVATEYKWISIPFTPTTEFINVAVYFTDTTNRTMLIDAMILEQGEIASFSASPPSLTEKGGTVYGALLFPNGMNPSTVMTATLASFVSSAVRTGDVIKTTIVVDLTGAKSVATNLDIIGDTGVCYIGQITTAINGIIFAGQVSCAIVPTTGADDIDLYSAIEDTGEYDGAITSLTEKALMTSGGAHAIGTVKPFTLLPAANDYLYLVSGEAVAGTYDAGKLIIELWGTPA